VTIQGVECLLFGRKVYGVASKRTFRFMALGRAGYGNTTVPQAVHGDTTVPQSGRAASHAAHYLGTRT